MKTKIIYISGGEVFAPSDVRGAFEAVRKMLNLSADTVIFGVPVDSDDVGAGENLVNTEDIADVPMMANAPVVIENDNVNILMEDAPVAIDPAPVAPKRGRKKKEVIEPVAIDDAPEITMTGAIADVTTVADVDVITDVIDDAVVADNVDDSVTEPVQTESETKRSAPILSVLGIVKPVTMDDADAVDVVDVAASSDVTIESAAETEPAVVVREPAVERTVTASVKTTCDDDACVTTETKTIETRVVQETITIDEPLERATTIEDIFAELEPLKEEKIVNFDISDDADDNADDVLSDDLVDDATLTKMATEFAAAQDNIPDEPVTKPGKIGKLKNILPFKKAKKEEPSVLGDLFGWAGIAANDDDEKFTVPSWALGNN